MRQFLRISLGVCVLASFWLRPLVAAPDGWQQLNGPLGGVVNRILLVDGRPLASLYSGGIYLLNAAKWRQVGIFNGLPENRTFDMVVDPNNPDNLYVTQMIGCGSSSNDGGSSWTGWCDELLPDVSADNYSSEVVMLDPEDSSVIYLAGHDDENTTTFLRTSSAAQDFEIIYTFDALMNFNSLVAFQDKFYLATRENGIWVSEDQGVTWSEMNTGLDEEKIIRFQVDSQDDQLYVITGLMQFNVRTGGALYQLNEQGTGWEAVEGAPESTTGIGLSGGRLWVGTERGELYREKDNGHFRLQNEEQSFPGLVGDIVRTEGDLYFGVGGYGIYRSTDNGKTAASFNNGLKSIATRDVFVHPNQTDTAYVVTWDRPGVYRTTNDGESFTILGKDKYVTALGVNPQNFRQFYAGGNQFYDVQVKKDQPSVWTERTMPSGKSNATLESVAVDPENADHVLAGVGILLESQPGYGLYYSYDRGDNWKRAEGIPQAKSVTSIVFNPNNPNIVYAASFGKGVYKSSDGGETFTRVGGDRLKYTFRLAISSGDPRIVVAGSNLFFAGLSTADQISGEYGGVFQTTNAGESWTEITASVRDYDGSEGQFDVWKYNFGHLPNYERILIHPDNPDVVIVGHHGESVVLTRDGGETWEKQSIGMIPGNMHNYAYCLGADADFMKIYTCSCGRGLFSGQLSDEYEIAGFQESEDALAPQTADEARAMLLTESHVHTH